MTYNDGSQDQTRQLTQDTQDKTKYTFTMPGYAVTVTAEFEEAPPHNHSFTYTVNNGKLTATCTQGCDKGYDTTPLTLTLTAPASLVYDGNVKAFTFADGEAAAWMGAGLELPTITYYQKYSGQGWYTQLNEVPVNAGGDYKAEIVVNNKAAQVKYTIDKATPYIKTTPAPNDIEYGKKLSDSTLFGGYAQVSSTDSTEVGGLFEWTQPDTMPAIADSNVTLYSVTFTPADTKNYNTASCQVTITVNHTHNPKLVNGQAATESAAGWKDYYECACGALFEDENGTTPIENLATWKAEGGNGYIAPLGYTVTFNMNGHGVQIAPQTVEEGNKATKPSDPTAEGWTFGGWYVDTDFSAMFDFNTAINANTTIYAKWTKNTPAPSGGGSSTPTVTVPVSGDKDSVKVTATVSGSTATVKEIKDADLAKVTGGESVEIDLTGLKKNIDTAKIPTTTVEKIAEQSGMSVKLTTATVSFDKTATQEISDQAKGNTVELVVDDIKEVSLNAVQKEAVQKLDTALIIDAYLVSNGTKLCTENRGGFNGGKATVMLPYEIKNNRSASNYNVFYVDDAGELEKLNASYDAAKKAFVFDIEHFSNYVVAYSDAVMQFVDVPASAYYYDAVMWAAKNGITTGADATHFNPNGGTTRAHVVTFLWRAAGCPEPKGDASKFVDVVAGSYYEKAVAWGIENGVVKGTSETTFSPNMICTRAHISAFMARFAGVEDADCQTSFTDVPVNAYYASAVAWMLENGITNGTTATTYSPNMDCTRAQIVTFLYRLLGK